MTHGTLTTRVTDARIYFVLVLSRATLTFRYNISVVRPELSMLSASCIPLELNSIAYRVLVEHYFCFVFLYLINVLTLKPKA